MTTDKFAFHKVLPRLFEVDTAYIVKKDTEYGSSWKKRGGVGAFMMLARKWDRLEEFMVRDFNYDIFAGIKSDPSGRDGSVLAEVRDLRRYLANVEAEMVARGEVRLTKPLLSEYLPGPVVETKVEVLLEAINEAGFDVDLVPAGDGDVKAGQLRLVPKPPAPEPPPEPLERSPEPAETPAPARVAPADTEAPQGSAVVLIGDGCGAWELDGSETLTIGGDLLGMRAVSNPSITKTGNLRDVYPLSHGQMVHVEGEGSGVIEKRVSDEYFRVRFGGNWQDVHHLRITRDERESHSLFDERVADGGGPIVTANIIGEEEPIEIPMPSQVRREPISATHSEYQFFKNQEVAAGSAKGRRWSELYGQAPDNDGRWVMYGHYQEEYGK